MYSSIWISKDEAISLVKDDLIDNAVVVQPRRGTAYIRSKPDKRKQFLSIGEVINMHSVPKKTIVVFFLVSTIVFLSICINRYRFQYGFFEAAYRTILFFLEDTIWSSGFSEDNFSKVKIGMNGRQVHDLLGKPLRKTCGKITCEWVYSWQKTGNSSFDRRDVIFNSDGRVARIRHEYYVD